MTRISPDISKPLPQPPFISRFLWFIFALAAIATLLVLLGPKPP